MDRPHVLAVVGELIAAAIPKHVAVARNPNPAASQGANRHLRPFFSCLCQLGKRAYNFRRWQFQVALNGGAEKRAPRSTDRFSIFSRDCIATRRGWSRYKLIENANGIPIFHDLPINGSRVDNMIF